MPSKIKKFISEDPDIQGGMPVISGTRVTVAEIIDYLKTDHTVSQLIKTLRKAGVIVTRDEVSAALDYAAFKSSYEASSQKTT